MNIKINKRKDEKMPVEVISYMLSDKDGKKRLQFQLVLQCAPFLKGLKCTSIMNVKREFLKELHIILKDTDIEFHILTVRHNVCLVFFYRRHTFQPYLMKREIQEFLHRYGYNQFNVDFILGQLSKRVCHFSREVIEFPHEIGAFLDYPLEDVKGFIQFGGRNSLMSGYWKVYGNLNKAKLIFQAYDKARVSAVNEYLTGKPLGKIVNKTGRYIT